MEYSCPTSEAVATAKSGGRRILGSPDCPVILDASIQLMRQPVGTLLHACTQRISPLHARTHASSSVFLRPVAGAKESFLVATDPGAR